MSTPTTHYSWAKPVVGGDNGVWGTTLNTDLDDIDTDLFAVSTATTAAQADADNAQTDATLALAQDRTITPTVIVNGGSGSSLTATIDLSVGGPIYKVAVASGSLPDLVVTFTNRPATYGRLVHLHITSSGSTTAVRVGSGSKQWAIPTNGDDVSASGTQLLGTVASGSQAAYALYIIGS